MTRQLPPITAYAQGMWLVLAYVVSAALVAIGIVTGSAANS